MSISLIRNSNKRGLVTVLHIGPDRSSKGGIASVLSGYADNKALFESFGYAFLFVGTCGQSWTGRIRKLASAWWQVMSGAVSGRLDIVHIHTATRGSLLRKWLLAATCLGLRQKYVIHIHNGAMERYIKSLPAFCRAAVAFVWKRSAQMVCLSRDMQEWLTLRWNCDPDKCPLIYNGISGPSIGEMQSDSPEESMTILFLGRLIEAKGVTVLLDAAEKLKKFGYVFSLLVGGTGDVKRFLDEVNRRDLSDTVKYLGWVLGERKTKLLAEADIFVLPSRSEGFPVSIVEAMAFGDAIVSTNIPGVIDAITHEREGLLVPPDDVNALFEALSSLISSPNLRSELSVAARRRFLECFTIEHTAKQLARTYRQIMQ